MYYFLPASCPENSTILEWDIYIKHLDVDMIPPANIISFRVMLNHGDLWFWPMRHLTLAPMTFDYEVVIHVYALTKFHDPRYCSFWDKNQLLVFFVTNAKWRIWAHRA